MLGGQRSFSRVPIPAFKVGQAAFLGSVSVIARPKPASALPRARRWGRPHLPREGQRPSVTRSDARPASPLPGETLCAPNPSPRPVPKTRATRNKQRGEAGNRSVQAVRRTSGARGTTPAPSLVKEGVNPNSPRGGVLCDLGATSCRQICERAESRNRSFAAGSRSPLTDSNRRPPPYHEREEGADSCGFARSGAASRLSLIAALRRVLRARATLVRPQVTAATRPAAQATS